MRKFLIHSGILLTIVVGLNLAYRFTMKYPRKNYFPKIVKTPYYFFGDSHAGGVLPMDSLGIDYFNFAYGSDDFVDSYNKISYLIDQKFLDTTSVVVVEVDLHLFSDYRRQLNNNDISGAYVNSPASWFNCYFPLMGEKRILSPEFLFKDLKTIDRDAIIKLQITEDSLKIKRRYYQQYGSDFSMQQYYREKLSAIAALCERHRVRLIGVIYPVHPLYKNMIANGIDYPQFRDSVSMCLKGGEFLDLSDSLRRDGYFRDQDHMNKYGSDKFLAIIHTYLDRREEHTVTMAK